MWHVWFLRCVNALRHLGNSSPSSTPYPPYPPQPTILTIPTIPTILTRCVNALRHLEELTSFIRVLGCFPVENLLLPLMQSRSNSELLPAITPIGSLAMPLRIAVIGFGTFGQFLARRWIARGHTVFAFSRTDYSALANAMGAVYTNDAAELARQASSWRGDATSSRPHAPSSPNTLPALDT